MTQRETVAGGNPVRTVSAASSDETYQLPAGFAPGRSVTIRREDSGTSGHAVTITLAAGESLDGVTNATAVIPANTEVVFSPAQTGVWESYGLANGGSGSSGPAGGTITFTATGDLTPRTGATRWPVPRALTITGVYLAVSAAPTGAAVIVDINVSGTTIFTTQSNRPQVAATANTGNSTTITAGSVTTGQVISVDIDQTGSTAPGADLTVVIAYT